MTIQYLCNLIQERSSELFEILTNLISINSENFVCYGNEKECAEYIYNYCKEIGLESEIYSPIEIENFEKHPDYFSGRSLENRFNVTARFKGRENTDALMLMGHIDTVEIGDVTNWDSPALSAKIWDGKIYGRGACDDKYALATVLFLMKIFKEKGFVPKENILFSAYCDEEYGGSHGALATALKYPCKTIINMDGREGQIWNCASGGQVLIYKFHTKEVVDSAKLTASAFPIIMEELEVFAQNRKKELENNRFYKGTIIPSTSLRYNEIRAGKNGADMGCGEVMFTFYTDKTRNEVNKELAEIEGILKVRLETIGITGDGFFPYTRFFHYGFCETDCQEIKNMLQAAKDANCTVPVVCGSCLSDLSVLLKYGSANTFAFGAGRGFRKEGGAHQANEYIECDKLIEYAKTIAVYILKTLAE